MLLLAAWMVAAFPREAAHGQVSTEPPIQTETIIVDTHSASHPFPHYWERMFGSGRASLSLRDTYRGDLRTVKNATGFEYVRFHAVFHDELGLYDEDVEGKPVYNFSYVDQIYDGLLENGVPPVCGIKLYAQETRRSAGATVFLVSAERFATQGLE